MNPDLLKQRNQQPGTGDDEKPDRTPMQDADDRIKDISDGSIFGFPPKLRPTIHAEFIGPDVPSLGNVRSLCRTTIPTIPTIVRRTVVTPHQIPKMRSCIKLMLPAETGKLLSDLSSFLRPAFEPSIKRFQQISNLPSTAIQLLSPRPTSEFPSTCEYKNNHTG